MRNPQNPILIAKAPKPLNTLNPKPYLNINPKTLNPKPENAAGGAESLGKGPHPGMFGE